MERKICPSPFSPPAKRCNCLKTSSNATAIAPAKAPAAPKPSQAPGLIPALVPAVLTTKAATMVMPSSFLVLQASGATPKVPILQKARPAKHAVMLTREPVSKSAPAFVQQRQILRQINMLSESPSQLALEVPILQKARPAKHAVTLTRLPVSKSAPAFVQERQILRQMHMLSESPLQLALENSPN